MEKRTFENLGISTSIVGFGCMRFPTKDGKIDEKSSEELLDYAIKHGINYFDTAYPYHHGESEPFVGKVLTKYPRDSYYLATKLPCWDVNSLEDAERIFNHQLERLNQEYVDFYLLHSLNRNNWDKMVSLGIVEFCEKLKESGKIRYLGFSFHDRYEVFEEIIKYRKWDFCQIQLNYMDQDIQAGMKGYNLAESLGIPLVIMESLKGGLLANLPDKVSSVFKKLDDSAGDASWALRWLASLPNVKVMLSGMSALDQVEDNIKTFENFVPLSPVEQEAVEEVRQIIISSVHNGCTGCNYCMPCPAGVDIPGNFRLWNKHGMYKSDNLAKYEWGALGEKAAAKCVKCGKCEKLCPQHLSIREDLNKVVDCIKGIVGEV